ncbi:hypothetical protein [Natrialba chahannaoensis]|nr:hypothetical protein [Natrialba chahannaoensis]
MERRKFIATSSLLSFGVIGCLGREEETESESPVGMSVESLYRASPLADGELANGLSSTPSSYQTVLADRAAAEARLEQHEDVDAFINETDFNESYLVAILAGLWSSPHRLELAAMDRTESGIHAVVETVSPDAGDHDLAYHGLVLRITDEVAGIPKTVSVEVDGEDAGTTERTLALGEAPPVSIEAAPDQEYEQSRDDNRVSIETETGETKEMAFAEWGTRQATSAAIDHVQTFFEEEGIVKGTVDGAEISETAMDVEPDAVTDEFFENEEAVDPSEFESEAAVVPVVRHTTMYSNEGELEYGSGENWGPQVDFETVVESTPQSAEVTVTFPERDDTSVVPVLCLREEIY